MVYPEVRLVPRKYTCVVYLVAFLGATSERAFGFSLGRRELSLPASTAPWRFRPCVYRYELVRQNENFRYYVWALKLDAC